MTFRVIHQQVHLRQPVIHPGIVPHKRQVPMYLPHGHDGFTGFPARLEQGHQIERHFRVTGKTVLVITVHLPVSQQLRHHIHASCVKIPRHMRVVAADVMLLGYVTAQHAAGLHEKFEHPNVGGQVSTLLRRQVGQRFIIAEQAIGKGIKKTFLQLAAGPRFSQGQGRIDIQAQGRVRFHTCIKCVHKPVGLTQPQRHGQANLATGGLNNPIHRLLYLIDSIRHDLSLSFIQRHSCISAIQWLAVLDTSVTSTTPAIIKPMPSMAGKSGICLKNTAPTKAINTIPTPAQTA